MGFNFGLTWDSNGEPYSFRKSELLEKSSRCQLFGGLHFCRSRIFASRALFWIVCPTRPTTEAWCKPGSTMPGWKTYSPSDFLIPHVEWDGLEGGRLYFPKLGSIVSIQVDTKHARSIFCRCMSVTALNLICHCIKENMLGSILFLCASRGIP